MTSSMKIEDTSVCPEHYYLLRGMGWQHKEIAKSWGMGRSTLYERLCEWPECEPELSAEAQRFIECSLLGDGCIVQSGRKARFQLDGVSRAYVSWIKSSLFGLGFAVSNVKPYWTGPGDRVTSFVHASYTRMSSLLVFLRRKWYPKGVKYVPEGFEWGIDALDRIIAEDGSRTSKNVVSVYWGAKDDAAFEVLRGFVGSFVECKEGARSKTAGRCLYIYGYRSVGLPGHEKKFCM